LTTAPNDLQYFDYILQHLQQARGFDFTAYKRPSLVRRVLRRMQAVGTSTYEEYYDHLQLHEAEFSALFNTILINVTGFFRDPDVWEYLRTDVLPRTFADRSAEEPFRVWSAGCASGQEAYTILLLLAELLGPEAVRDRVKVYATDADEEALNEARLATYSDREVEGVPPALLEKYFDRSATSYTIRRDLRRSVIFGRHDLLQDAPISRVDLLMCRNTLMYFNADAQERILARFFFSLNPAGHILLGRAEMLFSHPTMFTAVDLKRRFFTVARKTGHRERLFLLAQTGREASGHAMPVQSRLREAAFESDRAPQIVINADGAVVAANAPARELFGLSTDDVGRFIRELDVAYRPVDLKAAVEKAIQIREEVTLREVPSRIGDEPRLFTVTVTPLFDDARTTIGVRATYLDVTEVKSLQVQLQQSRQELETAYEELQSTNEELETTNEELQSTVEELETTNEELQSTNEELETMNEELQSTNEELQAMNDELRSRSTELNSANAFLESVFASLRSAVIVVDKDFRIQVWNQRSADLWGVRPDEAEGTHLLDLDVGFDVTELRQPVREVINGTSDHRELTVSGNNRRGKPILCRITIGPLREFDRTAHGAILLIDEESAPAA
jgi:two-component system, chemotaxis family, CheB/CheR fusion protein